MKNILLFTFLTVMFFAINSFSVQAQQNCQVHPEMLGAQYTLTNSTLTNATTNSTTADDKEVFTQQKAIWRSKQKVLSVNGEKSNTWFKQNNGAVQKTAHFDQFKRSIEYQSKVISDERWQQLNQFISDKQRDSLTLINTKQVGCWQQETYQWQDKEKQLTGELVWNADLKLVTLLTISQTINQPINQYYTQQIMRKSHWQLNNIEQNEKLIAQEFTQRANYQSTDFADIGDNESDPFLLKMINLVFIEHGASGFYNSDGQPMAAVHHH